MLAVTRVFDLTQASLACTQEQAVEESLGHSAQTTQNRELRRSPRVKTSTACAGLTKFRLCVLACFSVAVNKR